MRWAGAGAGLYPTCGHLDLGARRGGECAPLDALSDDELRLAMPLQNRLWGKPKLRSALGASLLRKAACQTATITTKTSSSLFYSHPALSTTREALSSPWPISPTSPSCSRPVWILGATRKVSNFSVYSPHCTSYASRAFRTVILWSCYSFRLYRLLKD